MIIAAAECILHAILLLDVQIVSWQDVAPDLILDETKEVK